MLHTSFVSSLQGIRDVIGEIPERETVFMVATLDVDALATYHILSSIYQSDRFFGTYAAVLVNNNDEITQNIESNDDKTIFFLLNCGGQYRDFQKYKNKHFFVLDTCRPFYLCNVFTSLQEVKNVHLLVDKDEDRQSRYHFVAKSFVDEYVKSAQMDGSDTSTLPFDKEAMEMVRALTINPDANLNEDNFEEDDDLNDDKEMKDFIVNDSDDENENENEVESNASDDEDGGAASDNDSIMSDIDDNYYGSTREERVILYNNSDGFSKPSAFLLYSFLDQNSVSLSMRWAAIISITYHFLFDRFSDSEYSDFYFKLSGDNNYKPHEKSIDGISIPLDADFIKNNWNDLNIELLRHWTIYDACLNSTLVARKFDTWTSDGIEAMKLFIADLGITLQDAMSNWLSLPLATRENFLKRVRQKKNQYSLSSISYNSFERSYEQSFSLTASDHVFALLGVMQIAPPQKLLSLISNSIVNAKDNKLLIEQGVTKAKQMREAMNDIFKMVMENKSYSLTANFIAIDLTSVNLSHFNIALSQNDSNWAQQGSSTNENEPLSPVAFFQLTQHFMKLVKVSYIFSQIVQHYKEQQTDWSSPRYCH